MKRVTGAQIADGEERSFATTFKYSRHRCTRQEEVVSPMALDQVILAVIIGTLAAIVYSLRILVLMERRVARIDKHLEMLAEKIVVEERKIEREEVDIEKKVKRK
jgi:hypothetical protein